MPGRKKKNKKKTKKMPCPHCGKCFYPGQSLANHLSHCREKDKTTYDQFDEAICAAKRKSECLEETLTLHQQMKKH